MNNSQKVSIITPSHNCEEFIAETIASVQQQTYGDYEHIIIDDASTDQSVQIIKQFCDADQRIKLIELDKNSGGAVARNAGIMAAEGKYIAFLDADDLWHPKKLEKQVAFMQEHNYAFTFTSFEKFGQVAPGKVTCATSLTYQQLLRSNRIGCLTAMYDSQKLGKMCMPLIRKRQDYALWLQILKKTSGYGMDEILAYYRVHPNSISANKVEMVKWNWRLYRNVEQKNIIQSLYYLTWNVVEKIKGRG